MSNILIIDDDRTICMMLMSLVEKMGHDASCAYTLKNGMKEALSNPYDVVFLDVQLPDGSGLDLLPRIRETGSSPEVIIMTGFGDVDGAEIAIKNGAWDYIQKTDSSEKIILPLQRVIQYREGLRKAQKPLVALKREGIVGSSPKMIRCFDLVARAGETDTNVLVTGETGTGKELFARAIHNNSYRTGKAFVVVDCAALPETLVESMLFGHEKGAFTGADKEREGLIKQADRGTLFLDEVGELPMAVQKAFLRFLQERRFRPVGGKREIKSDFRLIAATNRNLDQEVRSGRFRDDLLFRLRSLVIHVPPLRERTSDIRDLAFYYMTRFCDRYGTGTKGFSPEFLGTLNDYNWPGNVRELINAMESSLSVARDEHTLFPIHLPSGIRAQLARASVEPKSPNWSGPDREIKISEPIPNLQVLLETTERQYLKNLLPFTGGKVKEACRISGLSRSRFYDRLKKYKISMK